jgi:predicted lipid-binding transport protein (Tim44 family)
MKRFIALALLGLIATTMTIDADAQRRLGGGRNLGKQSPQVQQRQSTPPQQQTPAQQTPAQQATPGAQQAAPGAAAAARPSPWKGALLGLAAGLGLAALASYFGFSETLTAILMAALVAFAVIAVIGFVLRRMRGSGAQPAYSAAGARTDPGMYSEPQPIPAPVQRSSIAVSGGARPGSAMDEFARGAPAAPAQPWGVPSGFDTDAFIGRAKDYFSKLQGAWDRGNLVELEDFTTRDMFVALTHELRARNANTRTEVLALDAALLGIESTPTEHLASVRFSGSLRVDGEIEQVDEVWNLSKPLDGSSGWLLAGIQQLS